MPRDYRPRNGPGGRPHIDDQPIARGVLFVTRIMGQKFEKEVCQAATDLLMQARAADVSRAEAAGKRKTTIGRNSARRRVNEMVANELEERGDTPLTGLPLSFQQYGQQLSDIGQRDGYAAARAILVAKIAHKLAWNGRVTDAEILNECRLAAEAWVGSIEASLRTR